MFIILGNCTYLLYFDINFSTLSIIEVMLRSEISEELRIWPEKYCYVYFLSDGTRIKINVYMYNTFEKLY